MRGNGGGSDQSGNFLAETHFLLYRADNHFGNFHLLSSWRNRSIRADLLNAKLSRRRVKGVSLRSGATRGKTRSVAGWRLAEGKMRVGFIGLGMMGKGMAANLQKAGHELVVHDLSRAAAEPFLAKGAVWANSPKQVGEQSEVVFTSLPVPADVEQVALGAERTDRGHAPRHRLLRHVDQFGGDGAQDPRRVRREEPLYAQLAGQRGPLRRRQRQDGDLGRRRRAAVQPPQTRARRDGRPGRLYRPDRRRLDRQARAQLHQRRAGRGARRGLIWNQRPGAD